jgi:hypothetical protein
MNEENLKLVVSQIFRKAQVEKEYCTFYGKLCVEIMNLELTLKGLDCKKNNNRKSSLFRSTLLEDCKNSFFGFNKTREELDAI